MWNASFFLLFQEPSFDRVLICASATCFKHPACWFRDHARDARRRFLPFSVSIGFFIWSN